LARRSFFAFFHIASTLAGVMANHAFAPFGITS
jgi:hypothetical protein